jgi:hypothetical protein
MPQYRVTFKDIITDEGFVAEIAAVKAKDAEATAREHFASRLAVQAANTITVTVDQLK